MFGRLPLAILFVALTFPSVLTVALAGLVLGEGEEPASVYDRPVLVVDPGPHTARISALNSDRQGRYLVSASYDKTVKIWAAGDGKLLRTIRLPAGPGSIGEAGAVAISPDGALIAVGGWTSDVTDDESIYLFDRDSGRLVNRVRGLPNAVFSLDFSADGSRLAAALGSSGVRVIDSRSAEVIAADGNYEDGCFAIAFDARGSLATTSFDGKVRLYDSGLRLLNIIDTISGKRPYHLSFSPDGSRLAVNYYDAAAIDVFGVTDGDSTRSGSLPSNALLGPLFKADTRSVDNGNLSSISWSSDGRSLYAAGNSQENGVVYLRRWPEGGRGAPEDVPVGKDSVTDLSSLPGERLAFATEGPTLGLLGLNGRPNWKVGPSTLDLRKQRGLLGVSRDGTRVHFTYGDSASAVFSVNELRLRPNAPSEDLSMARTQARGMEIVGWGDGLNPQLNGRRLPLSPFETSRSLAVTPDENYFVLGTDLAIHFFQRDGKELWKSVSSSPAWAVTISGDGRLVIVAYGDGTIRWHRLSDGATLLSFLPLADHRNWLVWTPEGFYEATVDAAGVLRWHVNYGRDTAPYGEPLDEIPQVHRPDVIPLVLKELDTVRAIGLADLMSARMAVQARNRSTVPPGAQLHIVAVGVSQYQNPFLRLRYADRDASDIAAALTNTQQGLFANIDIQLLLNDEATKSKILKALTNVRSITSLSHGQDLTVVVFSGQSIVIDNHPYLLPFDADVSDSSGINVTVISTDELQKEMLKLGRVGHVLIVLDACHSGDISDNPTHLPAADALRQNIASANVSVITSSSGTEVSLENETWGHSAFTQAFLEALGGRGIKSQGGLVSFDQIADYIGSRVPVLTDGRQHPRFDIQYGVNLFAGGG